MANIIPLVPRVTAEDRLLKAQQQAVYVRDLWIFLGSVLAFLTLIRALRAIVSSLTPTPPPSSPPTPSLSSIPEKFLEDAQPSRDASPSWRRIPQALSSAFRIIAFRLHVPIGFGSVATVSELAFILGYITVIFILLFINTNDLGSFWYEDRAAHFASSQLPLVVALAGKNNIISFFTGIGHEKLNILHRASARVCLILLWMHALCRVVGGLPAKFDFSHVWMQCGAVGLAAFTLAAILSIRPVRNAFFEFFLVSHIVLIVMFLLFGYLHARDPGFGDYIWPALVLWALDRVLRLSRMLWNNRTGRTRNTHESTATVELLSQDTVRLTFRRHMRWRAGQHAYVTLPTISDIPSEAHPFTIASIPQSLDGGEGPEEKEVVFLIRGRSGFTARLRDAAEGHGGRAVPALIDGPYGCPPDLARYHTCILIAGGSGVSYTLPLLLDLVHKVKTGKSCARRAVFVWSVRDAEHIKWISKILGEVLDHAQASPLTIDPRIYITGQNCAVPELSLPTFPKSISGDSTPVSPMSEKSTEEKLELPMYSALRIVHGRPSVTRLLREEISASSGPVSVDVAGPTPLSQAVSKALSSHPASPMGVLRGAPSVTLHVETFGMVH